MARKSTSHVQPTPGQGSRFSLWLFIHIQQLRQTMREIWHTPLTSLMTIGVIGVGLATGGFTGDFENAENVTAQWENGTQITSICKRHDRSGIAGIARSHPAKQSGGINALYFAGTRHE